MIEFLINTHSLNRALVHYFLATHEEFALKCSIALQEIAVDYYISHIRFALAPYIMTYYLPHSYGIGKVNANFTLD